ncbi:hypothetical protein EJ05DRAFT_222427 [Pseudovirgaria hyperparasitica]|uniref:Secreted protein n=1 Tax=Pseudovirgaria hyperparasitica TaxID=470096 RepID=A0A6A6VTR6_9PEZI|nr:uncharacterized protein EJ05DRAFT_222427 [Pseudovirgaria hyperparasitica]KAF2753186.1 hypothetical protein EJ05DRAFT_222427 [Pseudovirgaria hyperparasitica]
MMMSYGSFARIAPVCLHMILWIFHIMADRVLSESPAQRAPRRSIITLCDINDNYCASPSLLLPWHAPGNCLS